MLWPLQVGILQKMQGCKNTVRLLGCYETNEEVMVVTSLCSGGDLQKLSDVSGGMARLCGSRQYVSASAQYQRQYTVSSAASVWPGGSFGCFEKRCLL